MLKNGRQIDAVNLAFAFELTEQFSPVLLLKSYLNEATKVSSPVKTAPSVPQVCSLCFNNSNKAYFFYCFILANNVYLTQVSLKKKKIRISMLYLTDYQLKLLVHVLGGGILGVFFLLHSLRDLSSWI